MSVIPYTSIDYPESDGRPMAETDQHRDEMIRLIQLLKRFFAGQQVYVSGNLFLYYEQGNPNKAVSPDVFVVKDIEPHPRRVYKVWVERKVPDVVFEVTSRKTRKEDTARKPDLYRQLRVPEYFLFDPTQDYLDPPLQGYRAVGERYEPIPSDAQGMLISEQVGLRLEVKDQHLILYRLDTGERLLTDAEVLEAEAEARRAAEAEVTRLREELRRQRDR